MKNIYVFLADGFEMLEAFSPVDVLKRCEANVLTVSISDNTVVSSSQGNKVVADLLLKDIKDKDIEKVDAIVIPGGYPGYVNLRESNCVVSIVEKFLNNNKVVASICGGPTIFSYNNLALGSKVTAHSSTKKDFENKYIYTGENVTVDKNIITAIGAGHSLDFAFAIAEKFFDKNTIEKAKKGMEIL